MYVGPHLEGPSERLRGRFARQGSCLLRMVTDNADQLCWEARTMRQLVSDEQIESAIAGLFATDSRWADGVPGVRDVAKALRDRFDHAGTNERIRAALCRVRARAVEVPVAAGTERIWQERAAELKAELERKDQRIQQLERDLTAMTERAERAEMRELAHQDHYQVQIYELRQQLKALDARRPVGVDPEVYLSAKRELHAAQCELATLRAWAAENAPRRMAE